MLNATINNGSVAQLNRALDYGSRGYRFESCRNHKRNTRLECSFFCVLRFMMLTNTLWKVINRVSVGVLFLSIGVMSRFVFVLLPAADGCASAVQCSTLSLFDDDVKAHKHCFWGLTSKRVKCDKAYSLNSKPLPIKNRQAPFKPNFFILLSSNTQHSVFRQAHPLLRLPKVKSKDFPRKVYIPL